MTNKKTPIVLVLILVASLVLVGCGTTAAAEPAITEEPAAQTAPEAAPTEPAEPAPTEAPAEAPTEVPTEAPTEVPAAAPSGTVSFAADIKPILDSRCVNCHGGERTEEGLVMTDYASLMAGSENGLVIVPGDPANSKLVKLVTNQKMPKRGPKLTPPQVQIISDWVAAGAPNN